jgi:hypothetical protein
MRLSRKRVRVTVPLDVPAPSREGDPTRALTLDSANVVRVTGAPGQREEEVVPGDTVACLIEAPLTSSRDGSRSACVKKTRSLNG